MILWVNKLVNNNYLNQRVLIRCSHPESSHWDHTWVTVSDTIRIDGAIEQPKIQFPGVLARVKLIPGNGRYAHDQVA